ncbi:MAG: hypothetical protein ABI867_45650 [Kofleriaceae bacterium]
MRTLVLAAALFGCRGSITNPGSFVTDIRVANQALVVDHCVIENVHTTAWARFWAAFATSSYALRSASCWTDQVAVPK